MTLDELIKKGETFYGKAQPGATGGEYITGEEYEQWIAEVALCMEGKALPKVLKNQFDNALENAAGNGLEYLEKILGTLKAVNKNNYKQ